MAVGTSRPTPVCVVNGKGPAKAKGAARSALKAARNAAFNESFISASLVLAPSTILSPLAKTTDANPTIGLGGAGEGLCFPFDADVTWLVCPPLDLKILPWNANSATAAAQSKTTKTNATAGKCFSGTVATPESATTVGIGRSPTFVPVMMNFGSSVAGACGAVIFWKQVGHSITVPACDESHFMCWPHTGHAYLNSLMAGVICVLLGFSIPFSKPDCNPAFSFVVALRDRHPNCIRQMIRQWSWTTATANSFESDFLHRRAHIRAR